MKISVVITVFNLERYLGAAIDSVLAQTHPVDEIIVVDDGSTDASAAVAMRYGDKVRLVRMAKNVGVLSAFNAGIRSASGDILAFLDGDDLWMPNKVERIVAAYKNNEQVTMVTHLHEWIDQEGNATGVEDETHRNIRRIVAQAKGDAVETDRLLRNSILCYKGVWLGSAFSLRRRDLDFDRYEQWVYSLPGTNLSHQDQPLAAYMLYTNPDKLIVLVNEVLFRYRVYPTNSSGASTDLLAALRTIERSIATASRTYDLVRRNTSWTEERRHQANKLKELCFYKDLYEKRRMAATKKFISLFANFWNTQQRLKESKRFILCQVLGPNRFLLLKTKRRFK